MARTSGRTEQEIERLLAGYKQSGLTRRQYCDQRGIPVTTFDYYRRRREPRRRVSASVQLVKVELAPTARNADEQDMQGFTLVLAKGRRIESGWLYAEQDLARLIRIVETA